jgi:hypothetical protein
MPCWVLQGMIVVGGKVREYRTNYKLISTENKIKTVKRNNKHQKRQMSPMVLSWFIDEIGAR